MEERDMKNMNTSDKGHVVNDTSLEAFYRRNNKMSFILKKTEKIVTAIYMVTDFMVDSEPLRRELRTLAIMLLSKTQVLASKASEPDYGIVEDIKSGSENLIAFLDLATTIGLISQMNGNILKNELEKNSTELVQLYNQRRVSVATHPGYASIILDQKMFDVPVVETPQIAVAKTNGHEDKEQINTNNVLYKKLEKEDVIKENKLVAVSKTNSLGIKIARRNDVLNIVKVKGQVSIKDIVLMLKDVSEKTIQRELFSLVSEGVLKKEGEKRWSVYKLV